MAKLPSKIKFRNSAWQEKIMEMYKQMYRKLIQLIAKYI